MPRPSFRVYAAVAIGLALLTGPATALPERLSQNAADAVTRLKFNAAGQLAQVSRRQTAYSMLRATSAGSTLSVGDPSLPATDRAKNFLAVYGAALGLEDPASELVVQRISGDAATGQTHVHLNQVHRGLAVFGARLVVHMSDNGILGVNGVFVPGLAGLSTTTSLDGSRLSEAAVTAARKAHPQTTLRVSHAEWMVYPVGLLRGKLAGARLAYAVDVSDGASIRDRVFVDARTGAVLNRISQVPTFLNREIYTPDQAAAPVLTEDCLLCLPDPDLTDEQANGPGDYSSTRPVDQAATDNLYIYAGGTYALYENLFGRKGYDACDGNGPCQADVAGPVWTPTRGNDYVGQIQKSVYLVNDVCPNAYWNGDSTNYCPGFDADDVVSHEWSHAYTEYTHGLIYQYQSGALNESYSDIFGETYDLVNDLEGPLGASLIEGDYYKNGGSRWVMGEDLSEVAAALLLRDMWDPDDFPAPSPGSVDSENYQCGSGDGGGVHTNSGVPNHAYAMLVDGRPNSVDASTFNGIAVPGIGITKAANIYFRAESVYQTPTTNFADHADALLASCDDLVNAGTNLRSLIDGSPTGLVIQQADCDAVLAAVSATGMFEPAPCKIVPLLKPEATTPLACGETAGEAYFSQDWESGTIPGDWTLGSSAGASGDAWPNRNWIVSSDLPAPHTGKALFALNPIEGTCAAGGDVSGSFTIDTPAITITSANSRLSFTHYMQSELAYDGGNLKYSLNGGAFAVVPPEAFTYNGHSGGLATTSGGNTNPMAGQAAWSGSDQGTSTGSWGTTLVDIALLGGESGDTVTFRWEFGQDGCNGNLGWFVDEVKVLNCPAPPTLSIGAGYEDPDTDGNFDLNWVRPAGAIGPDLLQESTLCGPSFTDDAEEPLVGGSNSLWTGSVQWTSSPNPGSGSNAYYVADAADQEASLAMINPIVLPAGGTSTLVFDNRYGLETNYDFGYVEVSANGGDYTEVAVYNGPAGFGATPDDVTEAVETIDLTPYAGQAIKLRFRMSSDIYNEGSPAGWWVDNISITNTSWSDVAAVDAEAYAFTGHPNGTYCFRVNTRFPGAPAIVSPFSNSVTLDIAVAGSNFPPIADAGIDFELDEGETATLSSVGSSDPDDDPLTYSWEQTGGPAVVLQNAGTATATFELNDICEDTPLLFTVTVSDGDLSASDDVMVTVKDINYAPTANAGSNQTVDAGVTVTLSAAGSSDADTCQTLSYQWSQTSGPMVTLVGADTATATFKAPSSSAVKELTFTVAVTDNDSASDLAAVTITVNPKADGNTKILGGGLPAGSLLILAGLGALRRRFGR